MSANIDTEIAKSFLFFLFIYYYETCFRCAIYVIKQEILNIHFNYIKI